MINPVGKTDLQRQELKEAAEQVRAPLDAMMNDMQQLWDKISVQQLSLNRLCKQNGFTNTKSKELYTMYEIGQTFAVDSLKSLCKREIDHIENITGLFINNSDDYGGVDLR